MLKMIALTLVFALGLTACNDGVDLPAGGNGGNNGGGTGGAIVDQNGNPIIGGGASADFLGLWMAESDVIQFKNPLPGVTDLCNGFFVLTPNQGSESLINANIYQITVFGDVGKIYEGLSTTSVIEPVGTLNANGTVNMSAKAKGNLGSLEFLVINDGKLSLFEGFYVEKNGSKALVERHLDLIRITQDFYNTYIQRAQSCLNSI